METLLSALYSKLITWLSTLFSTIFGGWNWQVLFSWLPSDLLTAASSFILICFALAVLRILRNLLPF